MPPDNSSQEIYDLAVEVIALLRAKNLRLGTVESCTGGGLGAALTAISGSSDVFMGGLITYSNALKTKLASVPEDLIATHGAVSEEVAKTMAIGGAKALGVDVCVSITGIAGPNGGTAEKPVGLVYISIASYNAYIVHEFTFASKVRTEIRNLSVISALKAIKNNF